MDVITFGSPCQDLSVAGAQAGIHKGERSCLFFEAIRIIKEMRNATATEFPRYAVWENVPGAFNSNDGEDFKAVIEALCGVVEPDATVSEPPKGKWANAGCVVGDGYSLAWRVYDAQYWGVPQRRKRIYLVADFRGERAGEILFEPESVSRDSAEGREAREGTASDSEGSAPGNCGVICLNPWDPEGKRVFRADGCMQTLFAGEGEPLRAVVYPSSERPGVRCLNPWDVQSKHIMTPDGQSEALCSGEKRWGALPPNVCYALKGNFIDRERRKNDVGWRSDEMYTLDATDRHAVVYDARGNGSGQTVNAITGDHNNRVTDYTAICVSEGSKVARCLSMSQYAVDGTCSTVKARDYKGGAVDYVLEPGERRYVLRRLMPVECARLQGFPSWWDADVEGSDSARYKMYGNAVCIPCAYDVLSRVARFDMAEKERANVCAMTKGDS